MKVLKVGAVWCSGCLVMRPRWENIEKQLPNLETEYIEYDDNPEIVEKYGIKGSSLPVCIFLDENGNELFQKSGELSEEKLMQLIKGHND